MRFHNALMNFLHYGFSALSLRLFGVDISATAREGAADKTVGSGSGPGSPTPADVDESSAVVFQESDMLELTDDV
jgi:hypothetical protein